MAKGTMNEVTGRNKNHTHTQKQHLNMSTEFNPNHMPPIQMSRLNQSQSMAALPTTITS